MASGLKNSDGNTIGGEGEARNVISANDKAGVLLSSGSANNTITGNFIGTDEFGLGDLGNGTDGVQIVNGATGNTISGSEFRPYGDQRQQRLWRPDQR